MSIDAASLRPALRAARLPRIRFGALGCALGLGFIVRLALVWARATPNYFPDEYLYAALGRSLAALGAPSVRGHSAHFPALLQPLLTAPAWRVGSLEVGYRIVQALGAAAMTLAAVPSYLLARRLGIARGTGVVVGALTLLVPDALYAGLVVAEPFAYPLALGAAATGIAAIARPSARAQVLFLVFAVLAAFARAQFAVLPACFVLAVVVVGLRRRALMIVLRQQRLSLATIGLAAASTGILAAARGLGYYSSAGHLHADPLVAGKAIGVNLAILLFAGGWVLAPGAAIGLALAVTRPRSREELAFGSFTLALGAALLVEAALWGDTAMVQERYLFYVLPLFATGFALFASRGWPHARIHAVLALGLVVLAARMPLSGYARPGADDHSPFLLAVQWLQPLLGGPTGSAVLVASIATVLALAVGAAGFCPRLATPLALSLALAVSAAASAGTFAFDRANSVQVLHRYLPVDPAWVDHAGLGPTTLVTAYGGRPTDAEEQLFWNRSIQRVAILPGASPPDRLAADPLRIGRSGELLANGMVLRGPLLVDGYAGTIILRGARRVGDAPHFRLWRPAGTPRVALYAPGRYFDGYLGGAGAILIWPQGETLAGWLELHVSALPGNQLELKLGARRVAAGRVRVRVCSVGRWSVSFNARTQKILGGRPVSGRASVPRFVPDPRACPTSVVGSSRA
ncbi:MAG: hypothetical protein ABR569_09655 [Gaiellaceae bacterium]